MTEPLIRLLTENDAAIYRELRLQALTQTPQAFISDFETERQKDINSFRYKLNISHQEPIWGYYGIFVQDKLAGICQLAPGYAPKMAHIAHFYSLYVDPKYRGQGLAKKLIAHVLTQLRAQKIERLFISYLARNRCVRGFYDKLGFTQCGLKPKAIKENDEYDDEVLMVLEL